MLTCWPPAPRGTHRIDADILVTDFNIHIFRFGQYGDGGGAGVDTPARLGGRHALDAVNAGFKLQLAEHAAPVDRGDDLLVAANLAIAGRQHFNLPSLLGGMALIHGKQVAGEQRGFISARAGADFQNDAGLVVLVFRQEKELQFALERGDALFELRALFLGQLGHVLVATFGDDGLGLGELHARRFQLARLLRHLFELGVLARQAHNLVTLAGRAKARLDLVEAVENLFKFLVGQAHGTGDTPYMRARSSEGIMPGWS